MRVFPYRQRTTRVFLGTLFFAICAVIFAYPVWQGGRVAIFDALVQLTAEQALALDRILAGTSIVFVILGLIVLVVSPRGSRSITLAEDRITAPRSPLSRAYVDIPYASILDVRTLKVVRQGFLEIRHTGGKLTITRDVLPDRAAFDDLTRSLVARVPRGRPVSG